MVGSYLPAIFVFKLKGLFTNELKKRIKNAGIYSGIFLSDKKKIISSSLIRREFPSIACQ
ncbi:hypothetical protein HNP50_001538 [Elizabethkingia anophelis]|nr:hypothetical protein [Elizabethkingia anophelis]MCW2467011.1 hypothetical protein [Elizabethkingia anophelis]MCW2470841.1 hypothetical protein [Elizabethkingia anophelis]